MVNPGKRMRKLKPLLHVRAGPGAAVLAPPPAPRLTRVSLRYPLGPFDNSVHGARLFWRNHLRRLKYHNPALPVSVEHSRGNGDSPISLALHFEGEQEALKRIAQKSAQSKPFATMAEPLTQDETSIAEENPTHSTHSLADPGGDLVSKIERKSDPSAPSDTTQLYTLSISSSVRNYTPGQIWTWFKGRAECTDVHTSPNDQAARDELAVTLQQSATDRRRVKKGVDEMKAEKERLARAKGEAERLRDDM